MAAIAGQIGCVSLVIVFMALILGLWFDARLNQQGLCTLGLLIMSVPFSLYVMLRIALGAIKRIQLQANDSEPLNTNSGEEVDS